MAYAEFYHKEAQHPKSHAVRPAGPKAGMVMLSYTKAFASITLAIAIVIGQKSLELKQGVFIIIYRRFAGYFKGSCIQSTPRRPNVIDSVRLSMRLSVCLPVCLTVRESVRGQDHAKSFQAIFVLKLTL